MIFTFLKASLWWLIPIASVVIGAVIAERIGGKEVEYDEEAYDL